MLSSFRCRRRRRNRRLHKSSGSCWRNPFVVFILTFLALGSLRFRDRRTKRVDVKAMHNQTTANTMIMNYIKIEQGDKSKSAAAASFVKYKAVDSQGNTLTVQQWALALQQQDDDDDGDNDTSAAAADSSSSTLTRLLADLPFDAFYWETRPVIHPEQQEMEFVVVDAPGLFRYARNHPDPETFRKQFEAAAAAAPKNTYKHHHYPSAVAFDSLGKDARLIAPTPPENPTTTTTTAATGIHTLTSYSDLAAFVRGAPAHQVHETWKLVAQEYLKRCSKMSKGRKHVWLSTSGLGVAWLHFRLDSRPKYYTYGPYKSAAAAVSKAGVVAAPAPIEETIVPPN